MLAKEKLSGVGAILHECSINLSVFFFNTQQSQEILLTRHSCSMEWKFFQSFRELHFQFADNQKLISVTT